MSGANYERAAKDEIGLGRWPANVMMDEEAARMLDAQSGELTSGEPSGNRNAWSAFNPGNGMPLSGFGDTGGASRFFYCAKASTGEREAGLREAGLREAEDGGALGDGLGAAPKVNGKPATPRRNNHPTVKPIALMEWLLRLVSPPGAHVLEPFAGSGTTLVAAKRLNIQCTGIELVPEHAEIIRGRLTLP